MTRKYGWKRDLPDARDFLSAPRAVQAKPLPAFIDLSYGFPVLPPDQGQLGSCTAFMCKALIEYVWQATGSLSADPAALFIYYNTRVIEGTVEWDSGASIRNAIKSINVNGACHEKEWPYDIRHFAEPPSDEAVLAAKDHQALEYARVPQDRYQMRAHLAGGKPFGIGFSVYDNFETIGRDGKLDMPDLATMSVQGGHAVVVCGYDDAQEEFLVRNSYGPDWGYCGYFTMPYAYLLNPELASDFWTIDAMEA